MPEITNDQPQRPELKMQNAKILLVEDNIDLAKVLELHMTQSGYSLTHTGDGESGLEMALAGDYALVILDLMLPKLDGLEVLKKIREKNQTLLVMMLTSKSEELDKVVGLNLGADDYVTKPFTVSELIARINALLRRAGVLHASSQSLKAITDQVLKFGALAVDLGRRKVTLGEETVDLTQKEFDIVAFLAANPGKPFSRDDLINEIWSYDGGDYGQAVNNMILRVRKKMEVDPSNPVYLLTVRGIGYRFVEASELENQD